MAEKKVISVRLDTGLLDRVERAASARGINRTELIEAGLEAVLDAVSKVPAKGESERVPSPAQTGTAHWRDPSEEEIVDAMRRFPKLGRERATRMARAEAFQRDRGLMPPVGKPSRSTTPREVNGDRAVVEESDFARVTRKRAETFDKLRKPDSTKGIKPKEGGP